jgi:hypothetical protein
MNCSFKAIYHKRNLSFPARSRLSFEASHTYDQPDHGVIQLFVKVPRSLHELEKPIDKVVGEALCETAITPRKSLALSLSCNMGLLVTDLVLRH